MSETSFIEEEAVSARKTPMTHGEGVKDTTGTTLAGFRPAEDLVPSKTAEDMIIPGVEDVVEESVG